MSKIFKTQRPKIPLRVVGDATPRNNRFFNPAYYEMAHRPVTSELLRYPNLFTGLQSNISSSLLIEKENVARDGPGVIKTQTDGLTSSVDQCISGHRLARNFLSSFEMSSEWSNLLSEDPSVTNNSNCQKQNIPVATPSVEGALDKVVNTAIAKEKKVEMCATFHHRAQNEDSSYEGISRENVDCSSTQVKQITSLLTDAKQGQVETCKAFPTFETMDNSHRLEIDKSKGEDARSMIDATANQRGENVNNIKMKDSLYKRYEKPTACDKRIDRMLSNMEVCQKAPSCEDGFQLVSRKDKKKKYVVISAVSTPNGQHARRSTQGEPVAHLKVTKSDKNVTNYNKEEIVTTEQPHHRTPTSAHPSQRIVPASAIQIRPVKKNEWSASTDESKIHRNQSLSTNTVPLTSKLSPWAPTNPIASNTYSNQWTNSQILPSLATSSKAPLSSKHSYDPCSSFFMDKWTSFLHDFSKLRENYPDLVDTF